MLNSVANNDEEIIPLLDSSLGTAFYRDDSGKFVQDQFNILARQEIDEILYQYGIENKRDYKSRSSEEITQEKKVNWITSNPILKNLYLRENIGYIKLQFRTDLLTSQGDIDV